MPMLSDDVRKQVANVLDALDTPVKIILFVEFEGEPKLCQYCADTRMLLEEVASLNDHLSIEVHEFEKDPEVAETYQVDKVPAYLLIREEETPVDYGMRFYGIPAGYEFSTLIEALLVVSRGKSDLTEKTQAAFQKLDRPVHIQVYVTPT